MTVNVLCSKFHHDSHSPQKLHNYSNLGEVYIDLMQCHHIELDQIPMDIETSDSSVVRDSKYMYEIIPQKMVKLAQLKIF